VNKGRIYEENKALLSAKDVLPKNLKELINDNLRLIFNIDLRINFPQPNLGEIKYPKYLNSFVQLILLPPSSISKGAEQGARVLHSPTVLL